MVTARVRCSYAQAICWPGHRSGWIICPQCNERVYVVKGIVGWHTAPLPLMAVAAPSGGQTDAADH